jgi:hypothetical protein
MNQPTDKRFPDHAKKFLEKTGNQLLDLINDGKSNEELRYAFWKAGLRKPSNSYLEYYRSMFKDGKVLAARISAEFKKFLSTEIGMKEVTANVILDSIILAGFLGLKNSPSVSVSEMLKALELKDKYKGTTSEDILEKVKGVFAGSQLPGAKKDTPAAPVAEPQHKAPEKKEPKPESEEAFDLGNGKPPAVTDPFNI